MTLKDRSGEPGFSDPDLVASNELPANRRIDFDTTVSAKALTAKEMNANDTEPSEGGLAVSVALC